MLIVGTLLLNAVPWERMIMRTSNHSQKLLELLPSEDEGNDVKEVQDAADDGEMAKEPMTLLPAMRTHYPPIDKAREAIFECVR